MTEDTGFTEPPAPGPVPDAPGPAGPAPVAEDGDAPAAPPGPRDETLTPAEVFSATAGGPDPVLPPFIPDTGVPGWLADALTGLHRRLRNLGG